MNGMNYLIAAAGCDGGFNWYGFLIGTGMVTCIILAYVMGTKRGYYKDLVFDICIICIPLAIIGARLYYVIFDVIGGNHGYWNFKRILGIGSGGLAGLAIYGGLIGAILGAIIVHFWKSKKPPQDRATFLQMCDLAFTVVILGQAIGRWGNFANQEAFGNAVTNPSLQWFPYAVFIEELGEYRQATFFYESFCNLIGFALLAWIYNGKRKSFDGFSFSMYMIYYGVVRFFIEGLRSDSLYLIPNTIRVSQLLSALLVITGLAMILTHTYQARSHGKKPFIMVDKDKLNSDYYGYEKSILSHPNVYDKSEKEKGFFAKLFARTENTPDPEDAETQSPDEQDDGFTESEPTEDYEAQAYGTSDDDNRGSEDDADA